MPPVTPSRVKRAVPIKDHRGNTVEIVWYPSLYCKACPFEQFENGTWFPGFSYQVYFTKKAARVAQDKTFPAEFACMLEKWRLESFPNEEVDNITPWPYHLEIYTRPLANVLACSAHQRDEKIHRERSKTGPCIVKRSVFWNETFVIVIDAEDWRHLGATIVRTDTDACEGGPQYSSSSDGYTFPRPYKRSSGQPWIEMAWQQKPLREHRLEKGAHWLALALKHEFELRFCTSWVQPFRVGNSEELVDIMPLMDPSSSPHTSPEPACSLQGTSNASWGGAQSISNDPSVLCTASRSSSDVELTAQEAPELSEDFLIQGGFESSSTLAHDNGSGMHVTSIWRTEHSKTRPNFSITVYIAEDLATLQPQAIFGRLDKGLLVDAAWTLDVVRNVARLDEAFEHQSRASRYRESYVDGRKQACIRMILDSIAASIRAKLPDELWTMIERQLLPPPTPDYSYGRIRPHQDTFLYLDRARLEDGPLTVHFNHIGSPKKYTGYVNNGIDWMGPRFFDDVFDEELVRVLNKNWEWNSEQIHMLWSLLAERAVAKEQNPTLFVSLGYSHGVTFDPNNNIKARRGRMEIGVVGQTDSRHAITIHRYPLTSQGKWDEVLEVVDLKTGNLIADVTEDRRLSHFPLGGSEPVELCRPGWVTEPYSEICRKLWSGRLIEVMPKDKPVHLCDSIEMIRHVGSAESEYNVPLRERHLLFRLKKDLNIPRWRYGRAYDDLCGATLNMHPMPVRIKGRGELYVIERSDKHGVCTMETIGDAPPKLTRRL